jgi:hypothetical protein
MQRRFEPYKSSFDIDQDMDSQHGLDDLSSWSLDDNMKRILYDTHAIETNHHQKKSNIKGATLMNTNKKRVTIKDNDQDTLADLDADDYMFDNLLEDEKENEKVFQNILNDLSHIERKERQLLNREEEEAGDYDDDYVDQVSIDDLLGGVGSGGGGSESVMSSFIDWDQIDQLVDTLK